MQKKTHHSLYRLQHVLCQELKHLELCQFSHKKTASSASLKTPTKHTPNNYSSANKHLQSNKSPLVNITKSKSKPKGSTTKAVNVVYE